MRIPSTSFFRRAMILIPVTAALLWTFGLIWTAGAEAATVTFSGTVSYTGSYSGDSLYVAVLDTTGVQDVTLLALHAYPVGTPPFSQPYSLDFDNATAGTQVFVVALLDVDGGGTTAVTGADVFGWYNGNMMPTNVASATSRTGLDFSLPLAEVHGTLTFATGQTDARVQISPDAQCLLESFRPSDPFTSAGAYAINGVYPGTYCIYAEGGGTNGYAVICYGDPTCASPTQVTIGATDVKTGIDFDFASVVPVKHTTWGLIKSRY